MTDKLNYQTFSAHLNSAFSIDLNHPDYPEPLVLTLDQVNHMGKREETEIKGETHQNTLREETFSIVFKGPRDPQLHQGMVTLNHDVMGVLEGLFIVPVKEDDAAIYYEAIFN